MRLLAVTVLSFMVLTAGFFAVALADDPQPPTLHQCVTQLPKGAVYTVGFAIEVDTRDSASNLRLKDLGLSVVEGEPAEQLSSQKFLECLERLVNDS